MYLPNPDASTATNLRYAYYVSRRLRVAGLADLATTLDARSQAMLLAQRAEDDHIKPVQDAVADRDAADDAVDDTARLAWRQLGATDVDAVRQAPFVDVFAEGLPYFVRAKLADQALRYGELADRLETLLPGGDPVRAAAATIRTQLALWLVASGALVTARRARSLARNRRRTAARAWRREVETVYGALFARFGRQKADRFFPRSASDRQDADDDADVDAPDAPAADDDAPDAAE